MDGNRSSSREITTSSPAFLDVGATDGSLESGRDDEADGSKVGSADRLVVGALDGMSVAVPVVAPIDGL